MHSYLIFESKKQIKNSLSSQYSKIIHFYTTELAKLKDLALCIFTRIEIGKNYVSYIAHTCQSSHTHPDLESVLASQHPIEESDHEGKNKTPTTY